MTKDRCVAVRWLVVNADDGGLATSTDDAILRCAAAGVVRSATVAVTGPTAGAFVARARDAGLDVGLHMNFTEGRPLTRCASLTGPDGRFLHDKRETWRRAADGAIDPAEVCAEAQAQRDRLVALGVEPSHVDGHNHVHLFPGLRELLASWNVWVRVPLERGGQPEYLPPQFTQWAGALRGGGKRTDGFAGYAFCVDPSAHVFLQSLDPGARVTEFMVHPGSRPGSRFASSPARDRETAVLCDGGLAAALARQGLAVGSFREVSCA